MTDPARAYAKKYADLEAERDRYLEALTAISRCAEGVPPGWRGLVDIARDALDDPNGASREAAA